MAICPRHGAEVLTFGEDLTDPYEIMQACPECWEDAQEVKDQAPYEGQTMAQALRDAGLIR